MKNKVIDRDHLKVLIAQEMQLNGNNCDLNHLDVSEVSDMHALFSDSDFNGDISEWDVSKVESRSWMFASSRFNGDISKWNVSKVEYMNYMFSNSRFNVDLSDWQPVILRTSEAIFNKCAAPIPYWAKYNKLEDRQQAITSYQLHKIMQQELAINKASLKKVKI